LSAIITALDGWDAQRSRARSARFSGLSRSVAVSFFPAPESSLGLSTCHYPARFADAHRWAAAGRMLRYEARIIGKQHVNNARLIGCDCRLIVERL